MILLHASALLLATWALARVAAWMKAPPLLGMIAGGVAVAALFPPAPEALDLHDLAPQLRLAVLALVLLRAGMGLSLADLRSAGPLGIRLGLLPVVGDALAVTAAAHLLLGWGLPTAAVLGCLVAAISPAIVIPGMLDLTERMTGRARRVPLALLTGAPLDNIVAVVGLGVALDLALAGETSWLGVLQALPLRIFGGMLLGLCLGGLWVGLCRLLPRLTASSGGLWLVAGSVVVLGRWLDLSFVLGILALGLLVRHRQQEQTEAARAGLAQSWTWAQYILFGCIGLAVEFGPQAPTPLAPVGVLGFTLLFATLVILGLGQLGRALGTGLATARSGLQPKERLAAALAYVPKATIQAAFGSLALDRGLAEGGEILAIAILAIAITAPLGVLSIHRGMEPLLRSAEKAPP